MPTIKAASDDQGKSPSRKRDKNTGRNQGPNQGRELRQGRGSVYTPVYRVFLNQLVAARKESGLTQRALADKLGRSYSYVAKCETGAVRMDLYQIRLYLDAVGKPFLEFMQEYEAVLQSQQP